jgi:hypothetical protein
MDILKQLFPMAQGTLGKGLYFFGLVRMIHALYVTVRQLPCANISIFLQATLRFLCAGGLNSESPLGRMLRFYPHFSTFLTHVTSRALSFSHHLSRAPSMCLQITGLIFAYVALTCIILFAHVLVWFLTAVPRLLITFL